jgi:hypothetical protein
MAAVTGLVIGATPVEAQTPDGSANRAAMARLSFMEGRWRGEGWMMRGPGDRVSAQMTETVELGVGGVVLVIEGRGTRAGAAGGDSVVVHDALGVLAYDAASNGYVMRSWIASGQWGDFPVTLIEGGVSWSREVPGGRVRYTAHIGNGEWHEVGEFSRDGTTWMPILDIRLRREN